MNTTVDLSDSSIDCSVVIEDNANLKDLDKKRATKNGRKPKVSGTKLDDTIDLISSSDDENDESKDEQNNFQTSKQLLFVHEVMN